MSHTSNNLMEDNGELGIDAINSDPNFNFISKILNTDLDEDDFLFNNSDYSPYSEIDFKCSYIETNYFREISTCNDLSVLSLNIQSLPAKYNDLCEMLNELSTFNYSPEVICLQETWQIIDPSLYPLTNYHTLEYNTRTNARGGGVGIFVKNDIVYNVLNQYSVFYERILETLFIEITNENNQKIVIGSVYRPGTKCPGLNFTEQFAQFSDILSNILSELGSKYERVYIFGDFNLDLLKVNENKFVSEYVDTLFSFGFLQIVTKPTRMSVNSATLIDHILTNSLNENFESFLLCWQISDHLPLIHNLIFNKTKPKLAKIKTRNFSTENVERFKKSLSNYKWDHVIAETCPQLAYTNFSNTLNNLIDTFFPETFKKFNCNIHKMEPWMTVGILTSRRNKGTLYKMQLKNPSITNRDNYKKFRNLYNLVVRTAKKNFLHSQIESNSKNLRKTWQILSNAIRKPKGKKENCSSLKVNDTDIKDPSLMAESFNKFFATAAVNVVKNINPSNKSATENIAYNNNVFSLNNSPVTITEILEATKLLQDKKTPDQNGISSNFLKKIIFNIARPLHHIFRLSFEKGIVPSQLKIAKVIPIFKNGDRCNMDNYRPISLLGCISKIIEKIVAIRLTSFLTDCNILSKWQFGFRANHSTVHPMIHFTNFLSDAINQKKHSLAIFCDLKKAFDCCDHSILLAKLERYGVRGSELLWFRSYLTERKQFVSLNGKNSLLADVLLGVPQGSILGPLLFLLYINDLPLSSKLFSLLFADDTTLLASSDSVESLVNFVNAEFKNVCDFFRTNKLMLHPDKTKILFFSNTSNGEGVQIQCNNNNDDILNPEFIKLLSPVSNNDDIPAVKFLGVYFDSSLSFKYQVSCVKKKLSRALYVLRMVKKILPTKSLKLIYYSIFHCHLIYAIQIWSCCTQKLLTELFKLQKAAIRIICNVSYNFHTEPLFKREEILPLPDLVNFFKVQFMQRFCQKFLPVSFEQVWVKNEIRNIGENEIQLRNNNRLQLPPSRTALTDRLPTTNFVRIWEQFPDEQLKFIRKKTEFDSKLKKFYINDLAESVVCNRLFCPSCSTA
jgi:hypothetical protein